MKLPHVAGDDQLYALGSRVVATPMRKYGRWKDAVDVGRMEADVEEVMCVHVQL